MAIGLSGPPTIRSAVPTWQVLKQYLEEQIGTGVYPVGAWLPSVRELAGQLSVNRNTVSKVYQALGREGVLEVERGKGVRVAQRPSETRSSATRIDGGIHALVREASLAGLSRDWLLTRVTDIADETYGNRLVRAAFIECTPPDARQIAADLSRQLEVPVAAIDLADFLADPERHPSLRPGDDDLLPPPGSDGRHPRGRSAPRSSGSTTPSRTSRCCRSRASGPRAPS